jgi:hypothetical protein
MDSTKAVAAGLALTPIQDALKKSLESWVY